MNTKSNKNKKSVSRNVRMLEARDLMSATGGRYAPRCGCGAPPEALGLPQTRPAFPPGALGLPQTRPHAPPEALGLPQTRPTTPGPLFGMPAHSPKK